jgi:hypothetical protein
MALVAKHFKETWAVVTKVHQMRQDGKTWREINAFFAERLNYKPDTAKRAYLRCKKEGSVDRIAQQWRNLWCQHLRHRDDEDKLPDCLDLDIRLDQR